jgi:hypothetical protein
MAGLSTADLPAFAHYKAHKINKQRKEMAKQKQKQHSDKFGEAGGIFSSFFSRPPDRSEGVPDISTEEVEMTEGGFSQTNPLASDSKLRASETSSVGKKKKKEKVDDSSDWVVSTDPASGKAYKYNSKTGETKWIDDELEEAKLGKANDLEDSVVVEMLKKSPKDVPEMHSKEAFRKFFRNISKERVERLLMEANKDKAEDERDAKVAKRLKLLDGILV